MTMMRAEVRALLFDLDGTLVDTIADIHAALARTLAAHAVPVPDLAATRRMVGDGARTLLERALTAAGRQPGEPEIDALYRAFLADYEVNACVASAPFPHVPQVLDRLRRRGLALAVCTNKPERPARALLERLQLAPFFALIVGGDSLPWRKPDPRPLEAALRALGAPREAALMIGDSRNDVLAARAAGLPCVLVRHGYGAEAADALGADLVLDHLGQLPPHLGLSAASG